MVLVYVSSSDMSCLLIQTTFYVDDEDVVVVVGLVDVVLVLTMKVKDV